MSYYYDENSNESPFARFRRLKNDPRFIEATTTFCDEEQHERYLLAMEYARWWAPNVRTFRFELLVILERDLAVEMLIERQARIELAQAEDDCRFLQLEQYWEHKQLFSFWPAWVEHAHAVLGARIWTEEGLARQEMQHRMVVVDRPEAQERRAIFDKILTTVAEVPLEWGDYVPPLVQEQREAEARRVAEIEAAQERDMEALRELYHKQAEELERQREVEFFDAWDAGRLRIVWMEDQQREAMLEQCFPSDLIA